MLNKWMKPKWSRTRGPTSAGMKTVTTAVMKISTAYTQPSRLWIVVPFTAGEKPGPDGEAWHHRPKMGVRKA